MADEWPLHDAKNRLSRLVNDARERGPQVITRRGTKAAVVLSYDEYERLTTPRESFARFLRDSPWKGVELDIERSRDPGREVDL